MDKLLYGRCWEILVTQPTVKDVNERTTDRASVEDNPRNSYRLPSLSITELDFTLKTSMDGRGSSSGAGNSVLVLSNLSEGSVAFVSKTNNFVRIRAGYGDIGDASIIFTGMVTKALTKNDNGTRLTTLYLREADTVVNAFRTSISVRSSGNTYESVFKAIIAAWNENGVVGGDDTIFLANTEIQKKFPSEVPLRGGWSGDGFLRDLTDNLCKEWGYTWFISKNILHMYPIKFNGFSRVFRFDLTGNLIKSIEPGQNQSTGISSEKAVNTINLVTFLDGSMALGSLLDIPQLKGASKTTTGEIYNGENAPTSKGTYTSEGSTDYSGTYVIRTIVYDLDTRSNKWDNIIVADRKV